MPFLTDVSLNIYKKKNSSELTKHHCNLKSLSVLQGFFNPMNPEWSVTSARYYIVNSQVAKAKRSFGASSIVPQALSELTFRFSGILFWKELGVTLEDSCCLPYSHWKEKFCWSPQNKHLILCSLENSLWHYQEKRAVQQFKNASYLKFTPSTTFWDIQSFICHYFSYMSTLYPPHYFHHQAPSISISKTDIKTHSGFKWLQK